MNDIRNLRTGLGMDVHAFAEGRKLILGGVDIPHTKGLAGHSDADFGSDILYREVSSMKLPFISVVVESGHSSGFPSAHAVISHIGL